jgi:membrane protein implicated in regulation of membrane protease activity
MSNEVRSPLLVVALGSLSEKLAGTLRELLLPIAGESLVRIVTVPPIDGLRDEVAPGVWHHNGQRLEGTLDRELEGAIRQLRDVNNRPDLRSGKLQVLILAPMTDPVGSAAVVPVIESLQRLLTVRLRDFPLRRHLVCLSPGIEGLAQAAGETGEAEELRARRATACLRELEGVMDGDPHSPPIDFVWLLDSRGETDHFVTSSEDLLPGLQRMMEALIRGGDGDIFGPMTQEQVGGRRARYSSFGAARMRFPGVEYLEIATGTAFSKALEQEPVLQDRMFDAPALFGDATKFLTALALDRLPAELARDSGVPPVSHERSESDDYDPIPFRHRIENWESTDVAGYRQSIPEHLERRRKEIEDRVRTVIRDRLSERIASDDPGGLKWAEAWLAALLGKTSPWTERTDEARGREVAQLVQQPAQEFFDPLLIPILFKDAEGEGATEAMVEFATKARKALIDVEQKYRDLEASVASSLERIHAIAAGDAIVERPDTPESLTERLRERIRHDEGRRAELAELRAKLIAAVEELDNGRTRTPLRQEAKARLLEQHGAQREGIETAMDREWTALATARTDLEEHQHYLWTWLAIRLGGSLLFGTVAIFLWLRLPFVRWVVALLPFKAWVGLGFVALAYLAFDFYRKYLSPLRALQEQIRSARKELVNLRGRLIRHCTQAAEIEEEHARWGVVVDLHGWFTREIELFRSATERVRLSLFARMDDARKTGERLNDDKPVPPTSAFDLVLDPTPHLPALLEAKQPSIRSALRKFWSDSPPSEWIRAIVELRRREADPEVQKASVDGEIARRLEKLTGVFRAALAPELDLSVEAAFERGHPTNEAQQAAVDGLWRAAAPLATFAGMSGFPPAATSMALVGAPESGSVISALQKRGLHVTAAPASGPDQIHLLRLSMGHPAFGFSPSSGMLPSIDEVLIDPASAETLPPLGPKAAHRGDPEAHQAVAFALACGLAEVGPDGAITLQSRTYPAVEDVFADWATARGRNRRAQLEAQLEELQAAGASPSFRDRLATGLAEGRVKGEDRELVEDHIALLDSEPF